MKYRRITDYLDDTVSRLPEKVAYLDDSRELTFKQIRDEAYRLAYGLLDHGISKEPVGVFLDQCVEVVPSIMGCAYSGNFYSILDTEMPQSRSKKILETLRPSAIITCREKFEIIEGIIEATELVDVLVLIYEEEQKREVTCDLETGVDTAKEKVSREDVLFVLFTSGSTGTPKGVMQSHGAMMAEAEWLPTTVQIDEDTVFVNQAPFYFIMSTLELFQTVLNGCTTCSPPRMAFAFPGMMLEYMIEHKVNTLYWVPTMLCILADVGVLDEEELPALRLVMISGEAMPVKQLNMWMDAFPNAVFANEYGPTELADICAYYIVDRRFNDHESLPIGKAAAHMSLIVLDDDDKEIAADEEGELCGIGPSVAYGYINDPKRTAEVFTRNPLSANVKDKMYRTGDIVRFNKQNDLVFVARKDDQIKHMGHRIELGEIEAAAGAVAGVARCACVYDDLNKMIVLFYTGDISKEAVLERIKDFLSDYMLPKRIERLDALPLNNNGKIDKKRLKGTL